MKYESTDIRNVALVGHGGCGKTSLAEAIVYCSGSITRMGKVGEGNTVMDFDPEEVKRGISIGSSFYDFEWKKKKINLIDTPGDADFSTDAQICLSVVDNAIITIDAVGGVQIQTERMWKKATELKIPRLVFISKLERERADFDTVIASLKEMFKERITVLSYPIGKESKFSGVVDILTKKALIYTDDSSGKYNETDIPGDLAATIDELRSEMIESIAESNDALLEKFLEGAELTDEELALGVKEGIAKGSITPVFCGSGMKNIGIHPLLNFIVSAGLTPVDRKPMTATKMPTNEIVEVKPDPNGPLAAFVFKTIADPYSGKLSIFRIFSGTMKADSSVYNSTKGAKERIGQLLHLRGKEQSPVNAAPTGDICAVAKLKETTTGDTITDESFKVVFPSFSLPHRVMSFALKPKSKGDEDKVMSSIHRLIEEDMTLEISRDEETRELVLSGMGQVHLEVVISKLRNKFGVEVELTIPRVPYKETIKGKARVQGKYKKQTGGRGQYGDAWLEIEPTRRGEGFDFVDAIVGGVIPRQYIPACQKGIEEAMLGGVLAGYPVVDIRVRLVDGSYHNVDSSEMAFKIAASMGFKKGFMESKPILLEPIMKMEIIVSEDAVGDVMGDLNSRRGKVAGVEVREGFQVIRALVPLAEIQTYAPDLRSITSGRGTFTMELDHYEEMPAHQTEKIIQAAQKDKEE